MDMQYWICEYGKVLCGYLFLMFLWPSVVFGWHLKKKSVVYCFGFCVTMPIIIINTVVLILGLFHQLNDWIIAIFFYGIFAVSFLKNLKAYINMNRNKEERKNYAVRLIKYFMRKMLSFSRKYYLLVIVLIFGMVYFSYGAFQVHSYGYGDMYVHHEWVQGLAEGKVFTAGVYPEAMHCFIYCMNALFGIRIYSIMLFLQGVHVVVFLVSGYLLLRRVFHFSCTPVFVLALFLILDLNNADLVHNMSRLQMTLPMEFGLHTVFLCALYLVRYLQEDSADTTRVKKTKYDWDGNLFLFATSLAACVMIHFHVLMMLIVVCTSFVVFALKKIFRREYLIPLLISGFLACLIAIAPMTGALMQGIPFNSSINWAVSSMDGYDSREFRNSQKGLLGNMENGDADDQVSIVTSVLNVFIEVYEEGYVALYGARRAQWIFSLTIIVSALCLFTRWKICKGYLPVILASVLYVIMYAAPMIGLMDMIPEGRFFASGHTLLLAVMVMPIDIFFSLGMFFYNTFAMQIFSVVLVVGCYVAAVVTGNFRGYLYYELTRYNSAVTVTNSIIEEYPRHSYTIVSPTDELYQMVQYGWHEELLSFVEKSSDEEYMLPSEHVFLYIEKKPLLYAQLHFFQGPAWLGEEKYLSPFWKIYSLKYPDSAASQSPDIIASCISAEAVKQNIPEYDNPWIMYLRLDNRTVLESKAYDWCQRFSEQYPSVLNMYYEDENFICYYFRQENGQLYNLGMK